MGHRKSTIVLVLVIVSLFALASACASDGNPPVSTDGWTWISGSHIANQAGVYGTKNTAAISNIPGARSGAVSWVDSGGRLWLFGGMGFDSAGNQGLLNDLWRYDPTTLEWTWVSGSDCQYQAGVYGTKGTADPHNSPGGRGLGACWIDSLGRLWLLGGQGQDSVGNQGWLNDLWRYDPTTFEWTWISGSHIANQAGLYGTKGTADLSNVPGGRNGAVSWTDSTGGLWLFGGMGLDSTGDYYSHLNDLWRYDPTTLAWTWASGSNIRGQLGTYGTKGTADPLNVPGARHNALSWVDSDDRLWLLGGAGKDSFGNIGYLNDLWLYRPETLEWTWVSGGNRAPQVGVYGTKGTADPSNVPGSRASAVCWIDPQGKLWLFGGNGYCLIGPADILNDLWKFDPITLEWAWVSGSSMQFQPGIYGIKGIAASSNVPGARYGAVSWVDRSGKFWLFGGAGKDSAGNDGSLNDLWRYSR